MPENFFYGGGVAQTVIHPVVAVGMVLAILLILTLRRRYVLVAFLLPAFLAPFDQTIVFAGQHLPVRRNLIMAGCLRLLMEKGKVGKLFPNGLNTIDKAFIIWAFYRGLARILLFHVAAVIPGQIGFWIEAIGGYFLLRYLIQDVEDISTAAKTFIMVVLIAACCMSIERFHNLNVFSYAYTGRRALTPVTRNGLVRAQACFGHPILAGSFGATLLPLFYWLWRSGKARALAAPAMVGATAMAFLGGSSTAVMALAGGIGALFLWPIRRSMRLVRWGIVLALLALAMVMKAPVWALIARVNITGSSDAYGRSMLVGNFVRHSSDWWLVGSREYVNWGESMWDLSNQFVAEGQSGGLVCFIYFIAIISMGFSRLGKMRRQVEGDKKQEWLYWCLCSVMFAHILAYFGVSYWDQTYIWWFAFLAMVSAATAGLKSEDKLETVEEPSLKTAASA